MRTRCSPLPVPSSARLHAFAPRVEWFARTPSMLHGIDHEARVLIWTQVLCAMEPGPLDADVLAWAAVLHDVRREDDWIDDQHGALAADWLLEHPTLLPSAVPLERVEYLCRWHAPPDRRAPAMTAELAVFKDADALDRWRFDKPDPSFLRTSSAPRLLELSRRLVNGSRPVPADVEPFDHVLAAAYRLDLVS